ncbi:hypothetical protein LCGC14_1452250, partial [marine sediment metagenome]
MTSGYQTVHIGDFSGGLITNNPSSELKLNQSPDLDNILLLNNGFKKRPGDSAFNSSAMNSGANVQGLAYYKETAGSLEYLFAIAGAKIFKSDSLDGTMDEITKDGAATAPVAAQNNIWT